MKTPVFLAIAALSLTSQMSCQPSKYVVQPNEEIFGVWESDRSPQRIVMHKDGTYQSFLYGADTVAWAYGEYQIVSKRIDRERSLWYEINYQTKHPGDLKMKELGKIDTSTKVWEFDDYEATDLEKEPFPNAIDKSHSGYRVYHWIGQE